MSETDTAAAAARKAPGPMTTWIGTWEGDTFVTKARIHAAEPKDIREALKKLGPGDYDTITGRVGSASYGKKTVDTFAV